MVYLRKYSLALIAFLFISALGSNAFSASVNSNDWQRQQQEARRQQQEWQRQQMEEQRRKQNLEQQYWKQHEQRRQEQERKQYEAIKKAEDRQIREQIRQENEARQQSKTEKWLQPIIEETPQLPSWNFDPIMIQMMDGSEGEAYWAIRNIANTVLIPRDYKQFPQHYTNGAEPHLKVDTELEWTYNTKTDQYFHSKSGLYGNPVKDVLFYPKYTNYYFKSLYDVNNGVRIYRAQN